MWTESDILKYRRKVRHLGYSGNEKQKRKVLRVQLRGYRVNEDICRRIDFDLSKIPLSWKDFFKFDLVFSPGYTDIHLRCCWTFFAEIA